MLAISPQIQNLEELRQYIHETLCNQNDFELGAFPITERFLIRAGKPCGIFFCLHGPRSVRVTAIWETEKNTILFYSATGQRLHKMTLSHLPELASVAA